MSYAVEKFCASFIAQSKYRYTSFDFHSHILTLLLRLQFFAIFLFPPRRHKTGSLRTQYKFAYGCIYFTCVFNLFKWYTTIDIIIMIFFLPFKNAILSLS